jgi:hypothetical protein
MPSDTNQPQNVNRPERDRPHMDQIKSPAAGEQPPRQEAEIGEKGEHDHQEETRHTP